MNLFFQYLLNNLWGILGVLVSGIGLFIAYLQLLKIANKTAAIDETYKKTIEELKNNETLTNISTILQKIDVIKGKLQENRVSELKQDLSLVARLLVTLQSSLSETTIKSDFSKDKQLCNDLEVRIITENSAIDKSVLKEEYIAFSRLELLLTQIQGDMKFNKK